MSQVAEVNEGNFEDTVEKAKGVVLVDFWAPWCGPCRMMHPVIEKLAEDFAGRATVARCNVDENPSLAARFGVSAIPTLALFKDGAHVDSLVGVTSLDSLKQLIESNL